MQVPGVRNCHGIASRGVLGRQVFIEMHLIVDARDVETAHQITEAVEKTLDDQYGPVRTNIHVEPPNYESNQISYETGESASN
jgi:divalent metal cation (Fe/Co/Zn/Cd) transporter